ncbi:hypothetical protein [Salinibacter altiplanensis]|uniref:hypothetical protein n=1 Tax=Salinibacter altiplanensis TaxID=1803181 RepID=UPI000C9F4C88|nr:hypothetical protein [Salinibacter altiplanensis]
MQQTLLALLALMMATFFNFNQMQTELQKQRQVVRSEMEQMALGVSMQTMEVIRARAFDEATVGGTKERITDPSKFKNSFETGMACQAFGGSQTCDSVGDFHDMKPSTETFETPEFDMEFTVEVEVHYVDASMQEVAGPTFRKEVVIYIQDAGDDPFLTDPIRFSEVLSYY